MIAARSCTRVRGGQALVEFAIVFPVIMLVTLGIMQLALIFGAQQVVLYAAFCAARAALVQEGDYPDPEKAAELACIPITGTSVGVRPPVGESIPGIGAALKYAISKVKTSAEVQVGQHEVTAVVTHYYELIIPIVNRIFVFRWESFLGIEPTTEELRSMRTETAMKNVMMSRIFGAPHLTIKEKCTLPKPW